MNQLINPDDPHYMLGVDSMDETHVEFIELVNALGNAKEKAGFITLFSKLVKHTEAHFGSESELMEKTDFPAIREHNDEHQRLLGELHRFALKVNLGSIIVARAYVQERLPDWFKLHAASMDSALAAHIKSQV
jgi:hemerythrin